MSAWQHRRRGTAAAVLTAALSIAMLGCTSGRASNGGRTFAWFRPGSPPAAWLRAHLPGQRATLSYPSSLRPMPVTTAR